MATEMSYLVFRITNMKFWGTSEAIISKTLQLLSDLSVGYPFLARDLYRLITDKSDAPINERAQKKRVNNKLC